jgi:predicted Zn-dependent protease
MRSALSARWISIAVVAIAASGGGCAIGGGSDPVFSSVEGENETGREVAALIEEQVGLVDDPALARYVRAIGDRLASHAQRPGVEYHFDVVNMEAPNAFALPGGYVYVSRGLLALVNSEDELANVIAHEIGHVVDRHYAKRKASSAPFLPLRLATGIGGAVAGIVSPRLGGAIAGAGELTSALALAPYSRSQETKADEIGQQLAAESGWNPSGISTFVHTLSREQELAGQDPDRVSFLSTHPASPERIARTAERAQTLTPARRAPIAKGHADFLHRLDGLLVGPSATEGVFDGRKFLHPGLGFALVFPEGWETANSPQAVGASAPGGDAIVVLAVAAEGDDPVQAARDYRAKSTARVSEPQSIRVGGLRAARVELRTGGFMSRQAAEITWIAYGGRIYQVTGAGSEGRFDAVRPVLGAVAKSFHPLQPEERATIREDRLRLVAAHAGETPAQVVERSGCRWTPEEAAVANGVRVGSRYDSGALVKITRAERYRR